MMFISLDQLVNFLIVAGVGVIAIILVIINFVWDNVKDKEPK